MESPARLVTAWLSSHPSGGPRPTLEGWQKERAEVRRPQVRTSQALSPQPALPGAGAPDSLRPQIEVPPFARGGGSLSGTVFALEEPAAPGWEEELPREVGQSAGGEDWHSMTEAPRGRQERLPLRGGMTTAGPAPNSGAVTGGAPPTTLPQAPQAAPVKREPQPTGATAESPGGNQSADLPGQPFGASGGIVHAQAGANLPDSAGAAQNVTDVLNPPPKGYSPGERVLFRMADLLPRVFGGILAGGNQQVQHQYQKHPFTPFNWYFGYDDPPSDEEAMQWTTAQIAFNDALEAGLVEKNSPSLRPREPITIKAPSVKGDGAPGMIWVLEPAPSLHKPAGRYQAEIPSVSEAKGQKIWVPALGFANSKSKGCQFVKFDGIDIYKKTVVDRKFNVTGFKKQKEDIARQVEAMIQNPKWTLVIEVPSVEVGKAAAALYDKAIQEAMPKDGPVRPMPDTTFDIVPPGSTRPEKFDAGPISEVEAPRSSMTRPAH